MLARWETIKLEVTCKIGDDQFKKHFLGLSDNVSYFVEQTEPNESNPYHYRVIFRPKLSCPMRRLPPAPEPSGDPPPLTPAAPRRAAAARTRRPSPMPESTNEHSRYHRLVKAPMCPV